MRVFLLAMMFIAGLTGPALADADLFSRDTVSGLVDLRLAGAWGERSWIDGGYGKTRFGGAADGGPAAYGQIADADLVWTPTVDDVTLVLDLQYQPSQVHGVDLAQTYLFYRPAPTNNLRLRGRLGLFYPPISMEHEGYQGAAWTVANTITPSAINAWIGQEVKVAGAEGEARVDLGGHQFGATLGVFGYDDTAGTLLALRGWSLDDITGTATGRLPLPPMNSFIKFRQAPFTEPVRELDGHPGYYARLDWRLPSSLSFNATYYDNEGDKTSEDRIQWAWLTQFWNVGARFDLAPDTWLMAQAMSGSTYMGYPRGDSVWVDVDYSSAYLLATHTFGRSAVTGRVETFTTSNEPFTPVENYSENGWAMTGDYKFTVSPNLTLLGEVLHVWSDRPGRAVVQADPEQAQTVLQASARIGF